MVKRITTNSRRGMLTIDLAVACALFVAVLLPLSLAFLKEYSLVRSYYFRAVATEIVDGEMEVLVRGEWRAFQEGGQRYEVKSAAAANLPPGDFWLTRTGNKLRLEWRSGERLQIGHIVREAVAQ